MTWGVDSFAPAWRPAGGSSCWRAALSFPATPPPGGQVPFARFFVNGKCWLPWHTIDMMLCGSS